MARSVSSGKLGGSGTELAGYTMPSRAPSSRKIIGTERGSWRIRSGSPATPTIMAPSTARARTYGSTISPLTGPRPTADGTHAAGREGRMRGTLGPGRHGYLTAMGRPRSLRAAAQIGRDFGSAIGQVAEALGRDSVRKEGPQ